MANLSESVDEQIKNCLKEQLSEITLLRSMYDEKNELEFAEDFDFNYLERYVCGLENSPPTSVEFCLRILDIPNLVEPVEVTFYLSLEYPLYKHLNAFVRCNSLDNENLIKITTNLRNYILDLPLGQPRIFDCLTFLRENLLDDQLIGTKRIRGADVCHKVDASCESKNSNFERLWIYSHHIYSKFKRRHILHMASQLNLSGFSVPGKPGFVCVEGRSLECQEFWDTVRSWSWKKLMLKHRETETIVDNANADVCRKFTNFSEIPLDGFNQYLEDHKCSHAFSILLGFDNKCDVQHSAL